MRRFLTALALSTGLVATASAAEKKKAKSEGDVVREIERGIFIQANVGSTFYLGSRSQLLRPGTTVNITIGGDFIDKVTFSSYRADGNNAPVKYLEIIMEHVIVSNYSVSGTGGDIAVESVSLNYGIVTYNYKPQKEGDGTSEGVQPVKHDLIKSVIE